MDGNDRYPHTILHIRYPACMIFFLVFIFLMGGRGLFLGAKSTHADIDSYYY
jgi:hypothetical protein